jgi:hypothetical protein
LKSSQTAIFSTLCYDDFALNLKKIVKHQLLYTSALLALGTPAISGATQAEMDAYGTSKYTYCDAKILSSLWHQSISESKERIGRKVNWGDHGVLKDMINQAQGEARAHPERRCAFEETPFTYNDARTLARIWNLSVGEAKVFVEEKILSGNESLVSQLLAQDRRKKSRQ